MPGTKPACFDAACGRQKDALLIVSLVVPILAAAAVAAYLLRPPPQSSLDEGLLFEDQETGTLFEAPPGAAPERDRRGELAFRAVSWTPWPVEEEAEGERLRLEVGTVRQLQKRTFVFEKVLPQPSQLVVCTLERPLGIVFEEDARRKRAVVADFAPGGHAEQVTKRAALNPALAASSPLRGDVLRACTATNIVYQPAALAFGAQLPKRTIVVYGADGQTWPQVAAALRKGLVADGPVTLVLERRLQPGSSGSGVAAAARGGA
ncbi:peptidase S9 [Micractinium conductrix]|uniref:Peptidase S9 n=1 Tax=Micractinium conductrix TaxID=554055 RepID=A0A2P6VMJ9_9CHLO|nr:peptidase S9 [Micractinium conductrix]|eukprot:PSC75309.1 peptidase S9 [Micractinium conductrix]